MNLDDFMLRNMISVEEAELIHNPPFIGKRNGDVELHPDPMAEVSVSTAEMGWAQYQRAMLIDSSKFPVSETVYNHASMTDIGVGLFENNLQTMSLPASSNSDFSTADCGRKRRDVDDMKEKTIERRQKRMIKNRESAARSRARKQAYTNQLEHEVSCLRKTNNWLRKQEEVEKLFLSNPVPMPRYPLRRTSSSHF